MRYFDFHTHVILKQLFSEQPNIDSRISPQDVAGIPRICTDLPNIIQTQIHQSQLAGFQDEVLVGAVLYGLESYLSQQVIPLRKYLRKQSQFKMWQPLFEDIADLEKVPVYPIFTSFTRQRTLDKYLGAPLSFNVINKASFDAKLPTDKVNVFFVVEGCHSLVNSSGEASVDNPAKRFPPEEILQNLDLLCAQVNILAINLTHMQQSNLCNHAFGMQLAEDEPFHPHGNGLKDDGRKVVQGIFDKKINIDLKHMSYKSRLDLRNEIDAGKYNNVQHLLCTHAGFTGIPFSDWTGYIRVKKSIKDVYYLEVTKTMHTRNLPARPGAPAFNSTTINLFDEEIVWIVQHGGMIGLSMDRRIIGFVNLFDDHPTGRSPDSLLYVDKEYISKEEWTALGLDNKKLGNLITEDDCVTENDVKESTEISIPARNEYFCDHVLLQLKHFLQVCFNAGISIEEAQKHITIGSDFDGMINPFLNIDTVEEMPSLKKYIQMNFRFYLESLTDSAQWVNQLNVNEFAEALFFENGYNYVREFFKTR
jgi:microsomal dipeptidase-like Zn-dependent dipeptidase